MTPLLPMLAAYFALGLVRDALGALYYIAIYRNRAYGASGLAGIITLYDLFILANILFSGTIEGALAYACGNALGTLIALRLGGRK
jgi:hypothetical protein